MRFPLSMTAGMAGYIFKNKMRPKPEWQKTAAPVLDASNPFRILTAQLAESGSREPHPMINKRFPIVLMLEPLHACNLTCTGCGRIREYESTIRETIPVEQCLKAVEECGTPIVSICGGEPMIPRAIPVRLLRVAIVLIALFNLLALLVMLHTTPIVFTLFMFIGQPLFVLAFLLLIGAVLADLRARELI